MQGTEKKGSWRPERLRSSGQLLHWTGEKTGMQRRLGGEACQVTQPADGSARVQNQVSWLLDFELVCLLVGFLALLS